MSAESIRARQQSTLPFFETTLDDLRHPMWTHRPNPLMQRHREVALRELANQLQRFDDVAVQDWDIVSWCKEVHELIGAAGATQGTTSPCWLVGAIEMARIRKVSWLQARLDADIPWRRQPITMGMTRRSINVIPDLCERIVQAIAKEVNR